ncbi:MAG TPA: nickel pincer cofactor biosynthesis protein LarB, partial [Bacillota bacterium]|nr:nickel pincer cofactor biosynthesis protein LarB [Bacillota bacterium]
MEKQLLMDLLEAVFGGRVTPNAALEQLSKFPYQDLGFAKIDSHRSLRNGNSEVIYCPGKTVEQIVQIFKAMEEYSRNILATRANREIYDAVKQVIPEVEYFEPARIIALWRDRKQTAGSIGVISAGTADLPVAEEAAVTAELMGSKVNRIYDVGVAGIHRLFDQKNLIDSCRVLIVVAGMEGALASVVGGLVSQPIIGVPTSVGYGTNFHGLTALLSMLNSCASSLGVVNIDNGFGAGV